MFRLDLGVFSLRHTADYREAAHEAAGFRWRNLFAIVSPGIWAAKGLILFRLLSSYLSRLTSSSLSAIFAYFKCRRSFSTRAFSGRDGLRSLCASLQMSFLERPHQAVHWLIYVSARFWFTPASLCSGGRANSPEDIPVKLVRPLCDTHHYEGESFSPSGRNHGQPALVCWSSSKSRLIFAAIDSGNLRVTTDHLIIYTSNVLYPGLRSLYSCWPSRREIHSLKLGLAVVLTFSVSEFAARQGLAWALSQAGATSCPSPLSLRPYSDGMRSRRPVWLVIPSPPADLAHHAERILTLIFHPASILPSITCRTSRDGSNRTKGNRQITTSKVQFKCLKSHRV